jgi:hypothetical protein
MQLKNPETFHVRNQKNKFWELAWLEGTKRLEDLQKEAKNGN